MQIYISYIYISLSPSLCVSAKKGFRAIYKKHGPKEFAKAIRNHKGMCVWVYMYVCMCMRICDKPVLYVCMCMSVCVYIYKNVYTILCGTR